MSPSMDRLLAPILAFVAALAGAAVGTYAVLRWAPPNAAPVHAAADTSTDDVRAELAALRRLLERPAPVEPRGDLAGRTPPPASAAAPAPAPAASTDLEAAIARAVERGLEKHADAEKATKAAAGAPKPKKPLAEIARELNLSGAQEDAVRRAYQEATDKMLKVIAEPESDAESLRRELEGVRGDRAKSMVLVTKYMPKFIGKLGDVMAIQAERDAKIAAAVGDENVEKLGHYRVEEEDPFGMDGDVTVGVRAGDR